MNSKVEHTPGPWRIQDTYDGTIPVDGWSEEGEESIEICRVSLDNETEATQSANAALIAAAPELLAALEAIAGGHVMAGREFSALECIHEYQKIARAAIAKAKGE